MASGCAVGVTGAARATLRRAAMTWVTCQSVLYPALECPTRLSFISARQGMGWYGYCLVCFQCWLLCVGMKEDLWRRLAESE